MIKLATIVLVVAVFLGCSPKVPFPGGPVMGQKDIKETFQPILQFMEVKPGMTVADVGAGSGSLSVMMFSLMDSGIVYIQDIDTAVLKSKNVDLMVDYFSKQSKKNLRKKETFYVTIGDFSHSNLPDKSFDRIYSNATIHVMDSLDRMLTDLRGKLKSDGQIYFRDSFKGLNGEGDYCGDKTCGKKLLTADQFLAIMKKNGFRFIKQVPNMSGQPVYGFEVEG